VFALVKEGHAYSAIAAMLQIEFPGITREAISGIVSRRRKCEAKGLPVKVRYNASRASLQSRGEDHDVREAQKAAPAPQLAPVQPRASQCAPLAPSVSDTAAEALLARTGCAWPYGDVRSGDLSYCDAPCCEVRTAGGETRKVRYCSTHWHARRASANTKVLA
jgi:hypothetical protein